jgi:hypothetical protein
MPRITDPSLLAELGATPKIDKDAMDAIKTARAAALQSGKVAAAADDFLQINRTAKTGQAIGLPFVSDIVSRFSTPVATMEAISNQITPQMRPPGSGSSSDKDSSTYKRSFPNVDFTGPANSQIAARLKANADRDARYADFLEQYASQHGSVMGANQAFRAMQTAPKVPQRQVPQRTAGPVKISGDADYNRLPSGAVFIGPDGVKRTKP